MDRKSTGSQKKSNLESIKLQTHPVQKIATMRMLVITISFPLEFLSTTKTRYKLIGHTSQICMAYSSGQTIGLTGALDQGRSLGIHRPFGTQVDPSGNSFE
jgi:hypothetical protein